MKQAIDLAKNAQGLASPGAMVGCVIVKKDEIVGTGSYTYDGIKHAEILALEEAGNRAQGGTAYVSLEPCSHDGRTPPCAEALITAGISRLVTAMEDPYPAVRGNGLARLRKAGIEVACGTLAKEAELLNEKFIRYVKSGLPFGILKVAMSLDGKIATASGESKWITSEDSRSFVHQLRHSVDALLTGSGTVLADDPLLTDRSGNNRRRPLVRTVLDRRGRLHPNLRVFSEPGVIVYTQNADLELSPTHKIILGQKDLYEITVDLAQREIQSFLLECGPDLAFNALRAQIIDKIVIFLAPKIIGGREIPGFGSEGVRYLEEAFQIKDWMVEKVGSDLMVTGYVHRNH